MLDLQQLRDPFDCRLRLNRARLGILKTLETDLSEPGTTAPLSLDREREFARDYFPAVGPLPAFFTTIRFRLGDGAEAHLASIIYRG